jgi:signal peptidase II
MKKIFPEQYPAGARQEKRCMAFSAALAVLFLLIDQITKIAVIRCFALHESVQVINGILSWTYVRNRGAAWGILSGRIWLLLLIALAVLVLMVKFFRYLTEGYAERIIALALVVSGIFGNSIDRLWHGEVIDFIDVHYYNVWQYPVFNIADIAICTGVGLFILSNLFRKESRDTEK